MCTTNPKSLRWKSVNLVMMEMALYYSVVSGPVEKTSTSIKNDVPSPGLRLQLRHDLHIYFGTSCLYDFRARETSIMRKVCVCVWGGGGGGGGGLRAR